MAVQPTHWQHLHAAMVGARLRGVGAQHTVYLGGTVYSKRKHHYINSPA